MIFYPSRVRGGTKEYPYTPEKITGTCMVNPSYKLYHLLPNKNVLCDSGAFQDIDQHVRLTPEDALQRQITYRDYLRTLVQDVSFNYEALSIYDNMIGVDETVVCDSYGCRKVKSRGTVETAQGAISSTLHSAQYYATQRDVIDTKIIWIAQGVTPKQYVYECLEPMLTMAKTSDYVGMGGFCIIGKMKKVMLPVFFETLDLLLPMVQKKGIKRIHLFGVGIPDAVTYFAKQCQKFNIEGSTDTSAPEVAAVCFGGVYTKQGRQMSANAFMKKTRRLHWKKWEDYNPIKLAMANVYNYNTYIKGL